ncbi:MAG: methyltransferase domain-containing protein [Fimbriimonadaceae bacterium]|nr:methyltransferase domain-containing protein [Fimbriimonadaceae bacterium]
MPADTSAARLSAATMALLRCPACGGELDWAAAITCRGCQRRYPVLDGVPILLDEQQSLFSPEQYEATQPVFYDRSSRLQRLVWRVQPGLRWRDDDAPVYHHLRDLLGQRSQPRVLVVGGAIEGQGMRHLRDLPGIELVNTDIELKPGTGLVCDGHQLPFADASFDAVIAQAVLEHVLDPARCVAELHRVLQPAGLVYVETPFMQQVHGGAFDFTRYSAQGHRRLLRDFAELESGALSGPGSALAWSWRYFLTSFARTRRGYRLLNQIAIWTAWPWKHFDRWLLRRPGALDAASVLYFLGSRQATPLDDHELLSAYQGFNGVRLPGKNPTA